MALALALALAGCSWLKPSGKEESAAAKVSPAEEEEQEVPPATAGQIGSLASSLLGATRKKIQAARVEQLTKDDPDYSFCRGMRCPPRTPKQVVYNNEPEMQLKGITQRGEGSATVIARAAPAALERRSVTAAAYRSDGSLDGAAQEQIAALGRKHPLSRFQVIYVVLPNSTPQDALKATKRGVELERALIAGGVPKSRIELRADRSDSLAGGRVAEVLVLPSE